MLRLLAPQVLLPRLLLKRLAGSQVRWTASLMVLVAARVGAQTGTITGTVRSENGQTLSGAQVLVVGTTLGTRTGNDGRYTIVNVPAADYRVRVQFIGHRPMAQA